MGFAKNLILVLFERKREGYKRHADCTVICSFSLKAVKMIFI